MYELTCGLGDPYPECDIWVDEYLILIGGDKWLPTKECVEEMCEMRGWGDDMFARSALLLLIPIAGEFV